MGYRRRIDTIHSALAQLTALTGTPPRTREEPGNPGTLRIEADLPEAVDWPRLVATLTALDDLDDGNYGLRTTPERQTVWLRLPRDESPPR